MDGRDKVGVVALTVGLVLGFSLPSTAQPEPEEPPTGGETERTVSVSGTAIIRSGPDEAVVSLGVQTEGSTAEEALGANGERMREVLKALGGMGFGEDQLATSSVNLWPNFDNAGRTIVSYTATNQIELTVRDLSKLGPAIDRAVGAGANLASGISFRVSQQSRGRDRALQEAVADARAKAEILATAGDASIGRVLSIQETASDVPPPVFWEDRAVAAEAAGPTPIEPPTLETRVTVHVVWELV